MTAPPSPEDRQQAIDVLARHMTAQVPDLSLEDAQTAAANLIDTAILVRNGDDDDGTGGNGDDTEPD